MGGATREGRASGLQELSLGPRPSRDSFTKEGLSVVLSQHVRKTGNPIRSLDLKLSRDIKVVPHGTRMRGRADRI